MEMTTPDDFSFPFQPYEIQKNFMERLYQVLANGKIGIFESPTGTGKSLSLLCSTLRFLKDHEDKVQKDLQSSIENLNSEILSCIDKSDDWIEEQYQLIQRKQQLAVLEDELDKMTRYNQKIRDIQNKILEKERKLFTKKVLVDENSQLDPEDDQESDEQDDFLLAEIESDSEDESESENIIQFRPLQVFFCSRTHSQLSQLVGEVKSTIYKKNLRSVSLASRQNYCINNSVKQLKNSILINERCLELQKSKTKPTKTDDNSRVTKSQKLAQTSCPFYKKNLDKLRNVSLTKVMDIEELVKVGIEQKSCPYYSSRAAVSDSQLIFVPYQILFNKATREQCGINLKDSIVIIDEAHNLMDTISQIHTATVTSEHLKKCHSQLMDYKIKYVKRFAAKNLLKFNQFIFITKQLIKFMEVNDVVFKAFEPHEVLSDASIYNINLNDIIKFCDQTRFAQKVHGFSKIHNKLKIEQEAAETARKNATRNFLIELQEQENNKSSKIDNNKIQNLEKVDEEKSNVNAIRIVIQFIESLTQRYEGGRIIIDRDETTQVKSMKFLLLDPSNPFEDITRDCRSVILAGGTMKPTEELTEQLFKNCKDRIEIHSFGHVVPAKSILPIALSHGSSGKEFIFTHVNKNCEAMLNEASTAIRNICMIVPGGVVCFFTSYDNLNRIYEFMKKKKIIESIASKKDVYVEPRKASETEKVLENYSKSIKSSDKKGAILLSVIGGKLSEGMNFADDLGRCVIVVGLPFPNKSNPELAEKMKYLSKNVNSSAASEYYENLCMKAVNQSIGRAIRHIGDFATVILLDSRYHRQNILNKLPDWIKQNLVIANSYGKAHGEVAKFFKDKK